MSSENSTLVKLNNAGFKQNDKWLVEGVSLSVKKGKSLPLLDLTVLEKVLPQKLHWEFTKT